MSESLYHQKHSRKKQLNPDTSEDTKFSRFYHRLRFQLLSFMARRPHRSLRLTRRRDYTRELVLPGYWKFSFEINAILWKNKKIFIRLGVCYLILTILFTGLSSQESFTQLRQTITEAGQSVFQGNWSEVGTAGLLALSTVSGSIAPQLTDVQQVYLIIFGLFMWLTVVWLLRHILAKDKVRMRDGLYNAGAPVIPTMLMFIVLLLQILPILIAMIAYSAAQASGLLVGGVEAMLFWVAAAILAILSVHWITGTVLALVIVTLPGMYPMRALAIAGDIIVGRRLRFLFRYAWMGLSLTATWFVVLFPLIMLDSAIKGLWPVIAGVPFIPIVVACLSTYSLIWAAAYVYLLYRRVMSNDNSV